MSGNRLTTTGNERVCSEYTHEKLKKDVERECKNERTRCDPTDSCQVLKGKTDRHLRCYNARMSINSICFNGGDVEHREQAQNRLNGMVRCNKIFFKKCAQKQPKPITVPIPVPIPDENFIDKVSRITGFTGVALAIYLIISIGTRAIPIRNFIPAI